eukprot:symbB.v1.2.003776.t1/scaffold207.1/size268535/23
MTVKDFKTRENFAAQDAAGLQVCTGAICVQRNFTQLGGNLTITDASAKSGGGGGPCQVILLLQVASGTLKEHC